MRLLTTRRPRAPVLSITLLEFFREQLPRARRLRPWRDHRAPWCFGKIADSGWQVAREVRRRGLCRGGPVASFEREAGLLADGFYGTAFHARVIKVDLRVFVPTDNRVGCPEEHVLASWVYAEKFDRARVFMLIGAFTTILPIRNQRHTAIKIPTRRRPPRRLRPRGLPLIHILRKHERVTSHAHVIQRT